MLERDVAAPDLRVARRGEAHAVLAEQRVGHLDREGGQRHRLPAYGGHAGLVDQRQHVAHRQHADDRRRPADELPDAVGRLVALRHREHVGSAHPSLDRLSEAAVVALREVGERGRAGAAVEVLVGAADREVDLVLVEGDLDRPDRVAEVPEHEGPGLMRRSR